MNKIKLDHAVVKIIAFDRSKNLSPLAFFGNKMAFKSDVIIRKRLINISTVPFSAGIFPMFTKIVVGLLANDVSISVYVVCRAEPVLAKLKYALAITPGRYPRLPQDTTLTISFLEIFGEMITNKMLKIAANEKNKFPGLMQIENPRTNPNSKL